MFTYFYIFQTIWHSKMKHTRKTCKIKLNSWDYPCCVSPRGFKMRLTPRNDGKIVFSSSMAHCFFCLFRQHQWTVLPLTNTFTWHQLVFLQASKQLSKEIKHMFASITEKKSKQKSCEVRISAGICLSCGSYRTGCTYCSLCLMIQSWLKLIDTMYLFSLFTNY